MKLSALIVAMLAMLGFAEHAIAAVYKCTVNGQTVYSDKPCATKEESETGRMDTKPALRIGSKNSFGGSSSSGSTDIGTHARSKGYSSGSYSGPPLSQLTQAVGYISIAKNLGRDCDWAIDVTKEMAKCLDFFAYVSEHGPYPGSLQKIIDLLGSNPELASGSTASMVREGKVDAEQVEKYKSKAIIAAGVR